MDSIDKLLAQIKAESQEPTVKPNLPNPAAANDTTIDSLLEQVEGNQKPPIAPQLSNIKRSQPASDFAIDSLLNFEGNQKPPIAPQSPKIKRSQPASDSAIDSLLSQVKTDYQEQDKVEAQQKQQQIQAQQQKQQQQRQKQLEALKVQAQAWLEKLDPLSSEGLWFERFAEGYSTKLAAAIEYLQDSNQ